MRRRRASVRQSRGRHRQRPCRCRPTDSVAAPPRPRFVRAVGAAGQIRQVRRLRRGSVRPSPSPRCGQPPSPSAPDGSVPNSLMASTATPRARWWSSSRVRGISEAPSLGQPVGRDTVSELVQRGRVGHSVTAFAPKGCTPTVGVPVANLTTVRGSALAAMLRDAPTTAQERTTPGRRRWSRRQGWGGGCVGADGVVHGDRGARKLDDFDFVVVAVHRNNGNDTELRVTASLPLVQDLRSEMSRCIASRSPLAAR